MRAAMYHRKVLAKYVADKKNTTSCMTFFDVAVAGTKKLDAPSHIICRDCTISALFPT